MQPKLWVELSRGEDRFDDPEIVEYFESARLNAFAARPREGRRRRVDHSKRDASACEIDGEGQPRWSAADNQHCDFAHE